MAEKSSIESYRETLQNIRSEQRKPVYYLHGEESFFLDLLQEEIIRLLPPEMRDFNLDLLYADEVSPDDVLRIARSYPMMSERRIVVVRDFRKLRRGADGGGEPADLLSYLKQPNPSTILLLIDEKPIDKRTALGKALTARSEHLWSRSFPRLREERIPDWISQWAEQHYGKSIEPNGAQILGQLVGNNLQLLSTEIDKVCTFVDTRERVTAEDVVKVTGSYREYSTIELKEAVMRRDRERAMAIVEQMLLKTRSDAGEVIRTVGFFYSVFGNIWQVRRLAEKGMSKTRIQQEMGISSSWYFDQIWKDASRFHLAEIPQIFEALLDADMAAKGYSTLDIPTVFLLLIRRIAG